MILLQYGGGFLLQVSYKLLYLLALGQKFDNGRRTGGGIQK